MSIDAAFSNIIYRRAQILRSLRQTLDKRGYVEVETPLRVRTPGTDVNLEAFACEGRYLITSPELHMKRLLAKGLTRIYQLCHCFRKNERTPLHNPEFSLLEFYAAGLDLGAMMEEIEAIIWEVSQASDRSRVSFGGLSCDLRPPWVRQSVNDAFRTYAGWSPLSDFDEEHFYFDLVDKVERHLGIGKPTILYDYPAPLAMLARISDTDPAAARRFEVYITGVEIANAFEELGDSAEQRRRFEGDLRRRKLLGKPLYPLDEVFLASLAEMPPCCGIALGVDRLVMLLCEAANIDRVIAFPDEEV